MYSKLGVALLVIARAYICSPTMPQRRRQRKLEILPCFDPLQDVHVHMPDPKLANCRKTHFYGTPAFPKGSQPPPSQCPRQHPGQYLYTIEGFPMSQQGETPLERRKWRALYSSALLECPIGGPIPHGEPC